MHEKSGASILQVVRLVRFGGLIWAVFFAACGSEAIPLEDGGTPLPDVAIADAQPADLGFEDAAAADAGSACEGRAGTFRDQRLTAAGEARGYYLHVPAAYRCEDAWPVLVDYHGTAGDFPEEAYGLEALVALADREGFIVVRPRSRFSNEGFGNTYRWDQNPGDLNRNVAFTRALLADLSARYNFDRARIYASGFSSGTNMAAQFLSDDAALFSGFGFVGGGYWNNPGPLAGTPRIYAVTGFRDYLLNTQEQLLTKLLRDGLPADNIFRRENDAGHELYGWHFSELWSWLDRGERPPAGELAPGWTEEMRPNAAGATIELARAPGVLLAVGEGGKIWRRTDFAVDWQEVAQVGSRAALTGACLLPNGHGLAVGAGAIVRTLDGGETWITAPPAPEFFGQYFGASYLNTVGCASPSRFLGGGYWTGVLSDDTGRTWSGSRMTLAGFDVPAQIAAVKIGTASTAVAAGYFYLGRSDDGRTFQAVSPPELPDWLNDVAFAAPDRWWVAGEAGTILHSRDDGFTWTKQMVPTSAGDLYAIDFWDVSTGMAAGAHGRVFRTTDGGTTWIDVSTGLDGFVGDVVLLHSNSAIAAGEGGRILRLDW